MDARHALVRLRRPAGLAALAGGLLLTIAGLSVATAADPFVSGQPAARSLPQPDGGRAAIARADGLLAALGLARPPAPVAERLLDRLEAATYDEVMFRDARGRPTLVVRMEADGSLRHLARLDAPDPTRRPIAAADVPARAVAVARAAGTGPIGMPIVRADPSSGWAASWPRIEAGMPVLGDGIWVRLDVDGSVRSVARTASPLGARPVATLPEADARQVADRALDTLMTPEARRDVRVADARLAWVSPNDTFTPARPDAPDPVRRLAWVVRVAPSGSLAERFRGLELDLDAGTGELLGGDALE